MIISEADEEEEMVLTSLKNKNEISDAFFADKMCWFMCSAGNCIRTLTFHIFKPQHIGFETEHRLWGKNAYYQLKLTVQEF